MAFDPQIDKPKKLAAQLSSEIDALRVASVPNVRAVRRRYSRLLKDTRPEFMLSLAKSLAKEHGHRAVAYELLANHPAAFSRLNQAEVEELGKGINSWWSVDSFARTLAGPAWLKGQVSDNVIKKWALSTDRWWRRAALVSTVALNMRSQGGTGDVKCTLMICALLTTDRDDMVAKAMSWALRELVVHDPKAVADFLSCNEQVLPARVKREVTNKLSTGLKNPTRKQGKSKS